MLSCVYLSYVVYLWWNVCVYLFAHFQIGLLVFIFSHAEYWEFSYILDTRPLLDKKLANIFFKALLCLFLLIAESLAEQKFQILKRPYLSIFPFMDHAFGVKSKNSFCPFTEGEKKMVIWCKQLTHWKSPWCWDRLRAEGEEGIRGWEAGWHHWCNGHDLGQTSGNREGQGPGVVQSMELQSRTQLGDWKKTTTKKFLPNLRLQTFLLFFFK